jgi:hypothetical protein
MTREQFTIGCDVSCSDGPCGTLSRVVVDPVARALTHLVVEPTHPRGMGRLVPMSLVAAAGKCPQLRCTTVEFNALADADETHFVSASGEAWGYQDAELLSWPYYGLGFGGIGTSGLGWDAGPQAITYDLVPPGEVEIRRGEPVHATDGPIGRVQGLVINPSDHAVTHVLLDEGHLWGHKRVAIPIAAVSGVEDGVRLTLTKDGVRDLPPIALDQDA